MSDKYRPKVLVMGVTSRVMYTNYKGETRERTIIPTLIWYGHTDYHHEDQWFVRALDKKKGQVRDFALIDMKPNWK